MFEIIVERMRNGSSEWYDADNTTGLAEEDKWYWEECCRNEQYMEGLREEHEDEEHGNKKQRI